MRGAKLLLHTSAWEGAPNVIPEALAAGLPVIATENPGNRDALHEGTWGLLVPEKSSEITHFLTAFFESEDLSTELREWTHLAQASIQQDLTWQLTVNTYENLYQELTLSHSANT
jgi:glycosyltransferase involved in cell wall biosynthesis